MNAANQENGLLGLSLAMQFANLIGTPTIAKDNKNIGNEISHISK